VTQAIKMTPELRGRIQAIIDRCEGRAPSGCCDGKCAVWKNPNPAQKKQLAYLKSLLTDDAPTVASTMKHLSNFPWGQAHSVKEPICIEEGSPEWKDAYANWLAGKPPSADPRWKTAVFMGSGEVQRMRPFEAVVEQKKE
jgi:hypothetical protein